MSGYSYNKYIITVKKADGEIYSLLDGEFRNKVYGFSEQRKLSLSQSGSSYYGFVGSEKATITVKIGSARLTYELIKGMYFSSPFPIEIEGGSGYVVEQIDTKAVFMIGGPIEVEGRLNYIDGCSDSLIIPPPVKGLPCLNHLHIPEQIMQTQHTHPTLRAGYIVSGSGSCFVPDDKGGEAEIELSPGTVFILPPDREHRFQTWSNTLDIIAFHPDSDFGPDADNHPMVNRTIVDGRSATEIPEIRSATEPQYRRQVFG